jgi:hypothetical protein
MTVHAEALALVHVEVGDEWSPDEEEGWKRLI